MGLSGHQLAKIRGLICIPTPTANYDVCAALQRGDNAAHAWISVCSQALSDTTSNSKPSMSKLFEWSRLALLYQDGHNLPERIQSAATVDDFDLFGQESYTRTFILCQPLQGMRLVSEVWAQLHLYRFSCNIKLG